MLGVPFRGPKGFNHNPQWLVWMGYGVPFQWSHWYPAPSTNWMQPDELAGHFEPLGQDPQIQIVKTWTRPSGVKSRNLLIGDFNF